MILEKTLIKHLAITKSVISVHMEINAKLVRGGTFGVTDNCYGIHRPNGNICSLNAGHDGRHIAYSMADREVKKWGKHRA
jgi:hypothetical protein